MKHGTIWVAIATAVLAGGCDTSNHGGSAALSTATASTPPSGSASGDLGDTV
jgi:hypothetical protein